MEINLTWDLFIIVFFILIIAYSFIIGGGKTIKIMLGSYIAILAADGIGNLLTSASTDIAPVLGISFIDQGGTNLIILKIILFLLGLVLLGTKGSFDAEVPDYYHGFRAIGLTFFFACMSAALFIATILVFASGGSFLGSSGIGVIGQNFSQIYSSSYLVQLIALNYNLVFVAPAIAFTIVSIHGAEEDELE